MQKNHKIGFTLVEIMIAVVIIGLLAAMALPAFTRSREASQNTRFANDVRIFVGAIETFATELGIYPEDAAPGAIPAGLEDYIRSEKWNEGPTFGGEWDVVKDSSGVISAVGVHQYNVSDEQIANFDSKYDDGDVTSGYYRKLAADRYFYIIEE